HLIRGKVHTTSFSNSFALVFDGLNHVKMYYKDRFDLLKSNSVHNFLFKKKYITTHHFRFSEEVNVYSDLAFMVPALMNVKAVPYVNEAVYFERKREDPILNPSLSQQSTTIRIPDFLY